MNADISDIISQIKAVRDVIISRYMMGKILASTFALMVGMTVFSKIFDKYSRCNTGHIRSVCKEYEEGRMNGSFCKRLCSKDVSKVYQKCLSSTCDKIVYEIDFDGMPLVVKYQNIPETEKTGNEQDFGAAAQGRWLVKESISQLLL
ncbi:divergent protein kinase domain 1B-like isoform X2 [Rhopilema esculentum]|uniref:divergent protein kinase domain 1B-like isoform X2 n=1 Tax=Rhopilema esculentum TaxID=499914 RepID=UPI0031D0FCA2